MMSGATPKQLDDNYDETQSADANNLLTIENDEETICLQSSATKKQYADHQERQRSNLLTIKYGDKTTCLRSCLSADDQV